MHSERNFQTFRGEAQGECAFFDSTQYKRQESCPSKLDEQQILKNSSLLQINDLPCFRKSNQAQNCTAFEGCLRVQELEMYHKGLSAKLNSQELFKISTEEEIAKVKSFFEKNKEYYEMLVRQNEDLQASCRELKGRLISLEADKRMVVEERDVLERKLKFW